jgi:peptidoglycan hydrolase-like protein with peptidoglycan-binding domain
MKGKIAALILIASVVVSRADQMIERLQQALKNQGFYYGEITGEKNAELTAAIRRYQIRNGLQVNGELDTETVNSIETNSTTPAQQPGNGASPEAVQPSAEKSPGERADLTPPPVQPFTNPSPDQQIYPSHPASPAASATGVLARTPFETAPPEVQRNVIVSAQIALARRGLYHGEINGVYGPAMQTSLRAYQARAKIPVTGQLDLETLAALRMLPHPTQPFFGPAHRHLRPPPGPPPPQGEWIPE